MFFFGPVNLSASTLTVPTITLTIGGPTVTVPISIVGALESRTITFLKIDPAPGIGNSTTNPSSGFFNSGTGGASGFQNVGGGSSGVWNSGLSSAIGNSGFRTSARCSQAGRTWATPYRAFSTPVR